MYHIRPQNKVLEKERRWKDSIQTKNFLLKKSYVRTRLSAIPECRWQWASIDSASASVNERASSATKEQHRKDLDEGAQALFHIQFSEEDS